MKARFNTHTSERGNRYYDVVENAGQQYYNTVGIQSIYIATDSGEAGRDPIYLEERDEEAIQLFDYVMFHAPNGVPVMSNDKSQFDYLSWLSTGEYWLSKKDFNMLTSEKNQFNSPITGAYTPRPGDLVIMQIDKYFPIFEITNVDDDQFHTVDKRFFWNIKLESVTNRMIDFSNVRDDLVDIIRDYIYDGTSGETGIGDLTPPDFTPDPEKEQILNNVMDALDRIIEPSEDWSESIDTTLSINDEVKDDERNIHEPNAGDEQMNYPYGVY